MIRPAICWLSEIPVAWRKVFNPVGIRPKTATNAKATIPSAIATSARLKAVSDRRVLFILWAVVTDVSIGGINLNGGIVRRRSTHAVEPRVVQGQKPVRRVRRKIRGTIRPKP